MLMQDIPYKVRFAFRRAPVPQSNEDRLWREVLARAVLDALGYTGMSEIWKHNKAMYESQKWFCEKDEVEFVCDLAAVDFKPVRETILAFLNIQCDEEVKECGG